MEKRPIGRPRKSPEAPLVHITALVRTATADEINRLMKEAGIPRGEAIDRLIATKKRNRAAA